MAVFINKSVSILAFYRDSHAAFLHPKGLQATELLIQELEPQAGERILELGVGTGASLVRVLGTCRETLLYGVDKDPLMLAKAYQRLRWCNLVDRVQLRQLNPAGTLDFATGFFDKIYVESVLGIQEPEQLDSCLQEMYRVLKPGGRLIINELLWNASCSVDKIQEINKKNMELYGLIQAPAIDGNIDAWIGKLKQMGWELNSCVSIKGLSSGIFNWFDHRNFISGLYTLRGKTKSYFNNRLRKQKQRYSRSMKLHALGEELEPFLIRLSKPTHMK